jgi:hypothetical protein
VRHLLLAAVVALSALPAAAQSSNVAQATKDKPGRIGPDTATSLCLGAPSTPACAAETLLACLTRGDDALCRAVGTAVPPRASGEKQQTEYVTDRVSLIRPEDVTDDLRDLDWFKPGYTLVEAQRRSCPASAASCDGEAWEDLQVYLRQGPDGAAAWEVVHWRSESEPEVPQELPDDPQRKAP